MAERPNRCEDCGVPVGRGARMCQPCKVARQTFPPKHCVDCGVRVDRRSERCPACAAGRRRTGVRVCPNCGVNEKRPAARWCWPCSYLLRGKREGRPPRFCGVCGKKLSNKGVRLCIGCKVATKRPQRHCPDCGTAVQRHVERCRACAAAARTVRQAEDLSYGLGWHGRSGRARKRAGWTCAKCGVVGARRGREGVRLHVHHIVPYRIEHDSRPSNLAVLCVPCHGKVHHAYRRHKCETPAQFRLAFARFRPRKPARDVDEGEGLALRR